MNLAFVILHYITVEETFDCVESVIQKAGTEDFAVVIVDNASPNNSYQLLLDKYADNARIHLINNKENLGFARGCNVGFVFAKDILKAEYIVLMNNDTALVQHDFYMRVKQLYKNERYAVMGPLILTKDGNCSTNPASLRLRTEDDIRKLKKIYGRELLFNRIGIKQSYYRRYSRTLSYIINNFKYRGNKTVFAKDYFKQQQRNVKLNGSFMVFSPDFIHRFDGLDNRTFMYFEEDILLLHILNNGLSTLYSPEIVVFHKEDSATDVAYASNRQKRRFIIENTLESMKVYLQVKKDYEENGQQV